MTLELIKFKSTDGIALPALLYKPKSPTKKVAIWLHGMGDSGVFYNSDRTNALGQNLTDRSIAFFSFNNRGAHYKKVLHQTSPDGKDNRINGGSRYEKIADCVQDIDGAVAYLSALGYKEFYLVGHSTGANKICVYNHIKAGAKAKNPFSAYVLVGPGDDNGLHYSELGKAVFDRALETAKEHIANKIPLAIMPESAGMADFSAQSAYDILNPNGAYNTFPYFEATTERLGTKQLFEAYRSIRIPTLVVIGENDEYVRTAGTASDALILLEENTHESIIDDSGFVSVEGADHNFSEQSDFFAKTVAGWLTGEGAG